MCYGCRDMITKDCHKTFEDYNININEYQTLSNEVFNEYISDTSSLNTNNEDK